MFKKFYNRIDPRIGASLVFGIILPSLIVCAIGVPAGVIKILLLLAVGTTAIISSGRVPDTRTAGIIVDFQKAKRQQFVYLDKKITA